MSEQPALPFDDLPEPISMSVRSGLLYICLGERAQMKVGQSMSHPRMQRRVEDHRKFDPTMRLVCSQIVDDRVLHETALKRILADYGNPHRIAGTEWFDLTPFVLREVIRFMDRRGADTTRLWQEGVRICANQIRRDTSA